MSYRLVKLSDVVTINPKTITSAFSSSDDVAFVAMADVSEDGHLANIQTRTFENVKKGYTCFQNGDVLLAKITPCFENGKATIVDGLFSNIGFGSTEFHVLRPTQDMDGRFLFHLVWNENFRRDGAKRMTGSAGQKRVPTLFLENFEINLPPLEEQKRIAAILDKADSLRRKRAQAIALADDFLRATFLEMFGDPVTNPKGWPVEALGNVTTFENGDRSSNYPSGDDLIESGILFLSTKNIVNKNLDLKFAQYISKEKFDSLSRGKPKNNDLIITLRGTLGNCCIYNLEQEAFVNAQMMIIRPGININSIFLQYFMTSKSINVLLQNMGQGAAVPQLTGKQLSELDVFVPSIDIQNKFEDIVRQNQVLIRCMEEAGVEMTRVGEFGFFAD